MHPPDFGAALARIIQTWATDPGAAHLTAVAGLLERCITRHPARTLMRTRPWGDEEIGERVVLA
jgi:hypothetical protein